MPILDFRFWIESRGEKTHTQHLVYNSSIPNLKLLASLCRIPNLLSVVRLGVTGLLKCGTAKINLERFCLIPAIATFMKNYELSLEQ